MKFSEIVKHARTLLQASQRISYRALKLEFELNEEQLAALTEELIDAQRVATDEDGKVLVWVGTVPEGEKGKWAKGETGGEPGQWTPSHLAEPCCIRDRR